VADSVRESISLPADLGTVWDLIMDPGRLADWVDAHRQIEDVPDLPLEVGSRFRQQLGFGPVSFWVDWKVVEARRPELARWQGTGPGGSAAKIIYRLSVGDDGESSTRFDYENAFDPPGGFVGAAATRVVNAAAGQREARKSMQRLRALFEDETIR
jgi:carbon monoxide dehydrogenase subunit G